MTIRELQRGAARLLQRVRQAVRARRRPAPLASQWRPVHSGDRVAGYWRVDGERPPSVERRPAPWVYRHRQYRERWR